MAREQKIREFWTVEYVKGNVAYLLNDEKDVMAQGEPDKIQRIARYINEYEHMCRHYLKFLIEMEKMLR